MFSVPEVVGAVVAVVVFGIVVESFKVEVVGSISVHKSVLTRGYYTLLTCD